MSIWDLLLLTYDSDKEGRFLPICHTTVSADLLVKISPNGDFISVEKAKLNILIPVTAESLSRSNGIAPHPLYDNLSYIGNLPAYNTRFEQYLLLLKKWTESPICPEPVKIFYAYISRGTLFNDIKDSSAYAELKVLDSEKIYPKFIIEPYVFDRQQLQNAWIKYYCTTLPVNGFCPITCTYSFIPPAYPGHIRYRGDLAKPFTVKQGRLDSMPVLTPGFIMAQKICSVLSFLCRYQAYNTNGTYMIFFDSSLHLQSPIISRTPVYSTSDVYFIILQSPVKGRLSITHYQEIPSDYYNSCMSVLREIYLADVSILDIITRASHNVPSVADPMLLKFLKTFFASKKIPKDIYMRLSTAFTEKNRKASLQI